MSTTLASVAPSSRPLRGTAAVLAAIVANAAASLALDQLFHMLRVYPAWGQPMLEVGDNVLALAYRLAIGVGGGWLAARLAPNRPLRHAMTYGVVGLVLGAIGAVVAIALADLGPAWYPVLLAAAAPPCAWVGGTLYVRARDVR